MTKHYTDQEKMDAVRKLFTLRKNGMVMCDGVMVENARALCLSLNVSSYSLYNWAKEFSQDVTKTKTKKRKSSKKPKPLVLDPEEIDFVDGDGQLIVRSEQRFYGFLASLFGIKSYGSLPLNQLKLKIGLRLIKESGLVPTVGD